MQHLQISDGFYQQSKETNRFMRQNVFNGNRDIKNCFTTILFTFMLNKWEKID